MKNVKIKFKCPQCGNNTLVQIRQKVMTKEELQGFFVKDESDSPGRKYGMKSGNAFHTEGKILRHECGLCGYILCSTKEKKIRGRYCGYGTKRRWVEPTTRTVKGPPLANLKHVFDWLKRHDMIEHDNQTNSSR